MPKWLEYHEEPVTLHSGGKSHWLVRGDLMFEDGHLRKAVLSYWRSRLSLAVGCQILGIPRGGIKWAQALAQATPGAVYVEPDGRVSSDFVIIVDDVITTGTSFREFRPDIEESHAFVVVQRGLATGVTAFWARMHLPLAGESE